MVTKAVIYFSPSYIGNIDKMDRSKVGELMVIAGNSHPELAELIAKYLI